MYGVGVVEGLAVAVGGVEVGNSEVDGGRVVGFGGGDVDDVPEEGTPEEGAPEEGAPEEGASRRLERGQCKPAMDASRLFSIKVSILRSMIVGQYK